jgi:hypothetical protein
MGLSPSPAYGPEHPAASVRQQYGAAPQVAEGPKGEGRAIASLVLTIVGILSAPFTFGLGAFLGLALACDAWEDIVRDPQQRGRGYAVATFWICGVCFALALVGGLVAIVVA